MSYELIFTKQAKKDAKKLSESELKKQTKEILEIIKMDPYKQPPPYKKLIGDLNKAISRRINIQHRLVYQVFEEDKIIKVIRMWSHYE